MKYYTLGYVFPIGILCMHTWYDRVFLFSKENRIIMVRCGMHKANFWWEKLKIYWRNFGNYRQTCEKPITSFPIFRKNDETWLWLTMFEKIVRNSQFQCTVKRQYVGEKDIVPQQNFHSSYKNLLFLTNLGKKCARRSSSQYVHFYV